MANAIRIGTALTALGLIGGLTACANPTSRVANRASIFGDKVDNANIGLATRAQAALEKGETAKAVELAERAVANTSNDAGFRSLLGNAYFAAGRFASAESAYKDSLTLLGNQPQVVLKLALVTIAQGKHSEAVALLDSSRPMLDASDYGLALALAGRPDSAAIVLDAAAREVGADSRVRQNLALAHALKGDWEMARVVASQDVAADQLDARIQQWATFAKPNAVSDQVASLVGITPAASDPGQPVRLALNKTNVRTAQAEQAPVVATPVVAPAEQVAEYAPIPEPVPEPVAQVAQAAPVPAPVEVAAEAMVPGFVAPAPMIDAPAIVATAAPAAEPVAKSALSPRAASFEAPKASVRPAALPKSFGRNSAVVQLGAYSSRSGVDAGWNRLAAKYPSLRGYTPGAAKFASAKGTVYRLSVGGFGSHGQAQNFCASLKKAGSACFVRSVAGDAPVRLASR